MYLALLLCACCVVPSHSEYVLVFEDHFDSLNLSKWDHEVDSYGGGNSEFQCYTQDPANSYTQDGILYLRSTLTANNTNPLTGEKFGEDFLYNGKLDLNEMYGRCTSENNGCTASGADGTIPPIMGARMRSKHRFSFKYGRMEVKAKMPVGDWLWPAIWLLPEDWEFGVWPLSGEIDVVEGRGNRELFGLRENRSIGIDEMGTTLHWGVVLNKTTGIEKIDRWELTHNTQSNSEKNFGDNFHVYVMEWTANGFRFFLDGVEFFNIPNPLIDKNPNWKGFWDYGLKNGGWPKGATNPWKGGTPMTPFDKNFHIVLNVAAGGTNGYFPDEVRNRWGAAPKPWKNAQKRTEAMKNFWNDRQNWYQDWANEGPNSCMQVDYVKVYQQN